MIKLEYGGENPNDRKTQRRSKIREREGGDG